MKFINNKHVFKRLFDKIDLFKYYWKEFWYYHVSSFLFPRQKWLIKKIPNTWIDKDILLEIAVLESLKHYCDKNGEDCFKILKDDNIPESYVEFLNEVKYYYILATEKLKSLQKELDLEWDNILKTRKYDNIDRLEKEIYDLKTEIMVWVIKNRNKMWT